MLKTIDILLGLSVVMLMVSLIVTVMTEAAVNLLQMRGKHLLEGVIGLLRQVDRDLPHEAVETIATTILTHPLIRSVGSRYGSVIHREELTKLVLELAADEGPQRLPTNVHQLLVDMLKRNGIDDPEKTLESVRTVALDLELKHPELSNNMRYSTAFLQEANSRFLAKINGWFDQTIDRVSDRFTRSTRIVTFCGSLLVALLLQLDTAELVNRLSVDSNLRSALVEQATKVDRDHAMQENATTSQSAGDTSKALIPGLRAEDKQNLKELVRDDVIEFPLSLKEWTGRWTLDKLPLKLLGIVLTAMLLSLGAPFWYGALKNLVRLRSVIAQKDDEQRETRQTTQVAIAGQIDGSSATLTTVADTSGSKTSD